MKRFLSFLVLCCLMVTGAWADVLTTKQLYTFTTQNRGGWMVNDGAFVSSISAGATVSSSDANQLFALYEYKGATYLWSQGGQNFINNEGQVVSIKEASPIAWSEQSGGTYFFHFTDAADKYINIGGGQHLMEICYWSYADEGNMMTLTAVEGFSETAVLAAIEAAIDPIKDGLEELIATVNAAYAANDVPLSIDGDLITSTTQFSSNATESNEGSLDNLLDGNLSTFWHSQWSAGNQPMHSHYLQVNLAEAVEGTIQMKMGRRQGAADDHPVKMSVEYSSDNSTYTLLPGYMEFSSTTGYVTGNFTLPTAAQYLRFFNDVSNTKQRGYWHCSEFQLNKVLSSHNMEHPTEAAALQTALQTALAVENPTQATIDALQTALETYQAAVDPIKTTITWNLYDGTTLLDTEVLENCEIDRDYTTSLTAPFGYALSGNVTVTGTDADQTIDLTLIPDPNFPFKAAESFNAIEHWYALNIHSNQTHYLYTDETGTILCNNEAYETADNYAWGFVGNLADGFTIYNKATGASAALDSSTPCAISTDGVNVAWIVSQSAEKTAKGLAGFCLHVDGQDFVNFQDGQLKRWSAADAGSTFNVEELILEEESAADIPYTVGKKYVISSVGHANEAVYYITNDGTNTTVAVSSEYPAEAKYWTAESVKVNEDGSFNVSFTNGGKYLAFMATTDEVGHAVKLSKFDVDDPSFVNIQDYLRYYPGKETDERFIYFAVKDDNGSIAWGEPNGTTVRAAGYSYQFKVEEAAEEPVGPIAPVDVTKNYYLFDTGISQYVVMPTSTGSSAYVAPSTTEKSAVKFVAVEGGYAIQDVATGNYIGIDTWNAVGSTTAQAWEVAAVEGGITIKNLSGTYAGKYFGGQEGKTKFYNNNDNPIVFTLEEAAGEEEPEFVEGTPIAAIEEFTDGATVYLQDAKFSKYIVNATTVADAADVNCYITLEQVAENNFRLKLSNGKYLSYNPETIANDVAAYDEEDQAKATVYTVVAQGTYWRFQFAFAEDATAEQTYNIVGGTAPITTWNKPDGAARRNFTVYKLASEEPVIEPEAVNAVYIKNGEGKYFGIGGEGGDINILDEGQTWNIAPVAGNANAYTLENAELDAAKRFVNSGSYGYTSKGEDYNAKNVYFYELTDAATGTCTLVAQPVLGKTYAMVIKNVNNNYAGYYAIYSGLAKDKVDRGDVIALGTEFPTTLTITEALSSSNGAITPAKALWTLTDTAEEPVGPVEPEYGATITAVFPNGNRHVLYSDGNKLTAAPEGNLPAGAISLFEIVSHEGDNIVLKAGDKYLHWTSGDDANKSADLDGLNEEYDEALNTLSIPQGSTEGLQATTWETTAIASLYELIGNGSNGQAFNFTLRENDDAWIAGNPGMKFFDTNWDGNGCRTSYFEIVLNEEPVGPVEPEEGVWTLASEPSAPVAGKTYALKNVSRNNYATNNGVQASFNKEVNDAIWSVEATGNTVDGAPTYYLFNKAENAYWKNDDFEGNPGLDGYDIHNYCGTNADWTTSKTEAMEVTILAAGSDATWRTAGAGTQGYVLALNRVVPDGDGGEFYFKLGQQGTDLAMEPWDEDVAWYFYEATFGEEPVGPVEPEFPLTGQPYTIKEKTSGMYLNVISNSEDNKKDVILKKKAQDLYFAAVEGGYTIRTADGLYVGGYSNGWNMSSGQEQIWVVEEVEGGYAFRTADAGKYLGFDTVENEGAAAFRDKNYATNYGIFELELNVFPAEGKAYQFKEKDSGMFLNVISDSQDNKKDVILKKTAQALYFTAVEGGYTIATENGLYVGASPANTWNMSSQQAQTWVVEEVEGGYALRTADAGKYLGFDTVDNEGAAAYRDKDYAANHGIFEITAYGTAELTAKDKLAAAIEEAKALNTTDVPEDLVETLQNAIEMAEGVLGDAAATDADYDEARGILEHAANAVKNYVPQTPAEMLADLKVAMEQAAVIISANKVEGQLNETTNEYELTSTVAGQVGYKPYDEVFNIAEDIAVLNWYLNLANNDADALEALLNEVDWSIRMCTAELVDFIAAYEAAGWVLPEAGKTYVIRLAPNDYSWAFYYNEGTLALNKWSTVKDNLTSDYAWTCKGLEDYNIVNSDLEVENLGQRVRFTSLAHPEYYLCWKGVTDNAKAGNSYWQISGKNSPQYGAMSMQAFDGSNHYKFLTIEVYEGSMNHGDSWNWVNNSTFSSWYTFEEVDPNQFEDVVGIGTVIAPADNALRFNLQGQRIAKDVRGINIVNGKKLIRK